MEYDTMLLFLGAGASKPFSIPDMNDLTNKVVEELKAKHAETWIIEDIKKKVENFGMKPDIEAVLTCVDSLRDPNKGIKDAGPFAAYISKFSKTKDMYVGRTKEFYEKLSKDIREIIRNLCFLPKDTDMLIKVYDNFFEIVDKTPRDEKPKPFYVFTTNYDYCFETYCVEREIDFFDGFVLSKGGQVFKGMKSKSSSYKVCKLHGSSNYMLTIKDELIKTDNLVKSGSRTTAGKIVKESMIYPTGEKYFSKEPYFGLLLELREELFSKINSPDKIIVIGYSFRDLAINNAFLDVCEKGLLEDIIFIDPNAKKVILENIPELEAYIKPINVKLEDLNRADFP